MFRQGVIHEAYRGEDLPATGLTQPDLVGINTLENKNTNSNPLLRPGQEAVRLTGAMTTLSRKATTPSTPPPTPHTSLVHQHENLSSPCKVVLRSRSKLKSRFKLLLGNIHIHIHIHTHTQTPAHIYPRCLPHFSPPVCSFSSPPHQAVLSVPSSIKSEGGSQGYILGSPMLPLPSFFSSIILDLIRCTESIALPHGRSSSFLRRTSLPSQS